PTTECTSRGRSAPLSCRRESRVIGGEGGIRTHVTVARKPHFECGAFDLSATSPRKVRRRLDARSVDWEGGGYRKLARLPSPSEHLPGGSPPGQAPAGDCTRRNLALPCVYPYLVTSWNGRNSIRRRLAGGSRLLDTRRRASRSATSYA